MANVCNNVVIRTYDNYQLLDQTDETMVFICKSEDMYSPALKNLVRMWLVGIDDQFLWIDDCSIGEQVHVVETEPDGGYPGEDDQNNQ